MPKDSRTAEQRARQESIDAANRQRSRERLTIHLRIFADALVASPGVKSVYEEYRASRRPLPDLKVTMLDGTSYIIDLESMPSLSLPARRLMPLGRRGDA